MICNTLPHTHTKAGHWKRPELSKVSLDTNSYGTLLRSRKILLTPHRTIQTSTLSWRLREIESQFSSLLWDLMDPLPVLEREPLGWGCVFFPVAPEDLCFCFTVHLERAGCTAAHDTASGLSQVCSCLLHHVLLPEPSPTYLSFCHKEERDKEQQRAKWVARICRIKWCMEGRCVLKN